MRDSKKPAFQKPSAAELQSNLTAQQYQVTQKDGTEPPFRNSYWDHKKPGIYVDVVSGEPLFSSLDKFDSGCGWPSFSKALENSNIIERDDHRLASKRTEIRSKTADSHLGHVFDDGPAPSGLRYCVNSAALRFIPAEKLEEEGYGEYSLLFAGTQGSKEPKWEYSTATLAGGCFWGVEEILRNIPGVIETKVGYAGGASENPTYDQVKLGNTGHAEAVQIVFDPKRISFEDLLGYYFRLHDPTTLNQQGNDIGSQYRSAIFYHDEGQKEIAIRVCKKVDESGKWRRKIVTQIVPFEKFYDAEEYHQDYLQKHPNGYSCHYLRD